MRIVPIGQKFGLLHSAVSFTTSIGRGRCNGGGSVIFLSRLHNERVTTRRKVDDESTRLDSAGSVQARMRASTMCKRLEAGERGLLSFSEALETRVRAVLALSSFQGVSIIKVICRHD